MRRHFRASWDKWVWIITVFFVALAGLLPLGLISYALTGATTSQRGPLLFIGIIILIFLAVTYLFAPQEYSVGAGELVVQRAGTDVIILLSTISGVEVADGWRIFRGAVRFGASGGAFGFFGSFWNASLKNFTAYTSRMDRVVIIYRKEKEPIVVSPDDIDGFVYELKREARLR